MEMKGPLVADKAVELSQAADRDLTSNTFVTKHRVKCFSFHLDEQDVFLDELHDRGYHMQSYGN